MKNVSLVVTGIKWDGCVQSVRRALSGIDVSLEQGRADVLTDDDVSVADLVGAVKNAGYDAVESA